MKKLLLVSSFFYAGTSIAMPMDVIIDEFNKNYELKSNQSMTDYTCSTGGCSTNIIEDNMIKSNIKFSEEKNEMIGSTKINVEIQNFWDNQISTGYIVCLSNNECDFYDSLNQDKANYSFENGFFPKKRTKRFVPLIAYGIAAHPATFPVIMATIRFAQNPNAPRTIVNGFNTSYRTVNNWIRN